MKAPSGPPCILFPYIFSNVYHIYILFCIWNTKPFVCEVDPTKCISYCFVDLPNIQDHLHFPIIYCQMYIFSCTFSLYIWIYKLKIHLTLWPPLYPWMYIRTYILTCISPGPTTCISFPGMFHEHKRSPVHCGVAHACVPSCIFFNVHFLCMSNIQTQT